MAITGIMAAPLSDGRLQVWASKNDGTLWTLWKGGPDPDSSWTQWQRMEASSLGVRVGCAAPLPNKALQLFVLANARYLPLQSGPGVHTTWKVSNQSTAAWANWLGFWVGEQAVGGGPGALSVAAAPLTDGRIQVFIAVGGHNSSRLVTRWKATTDVNAAWTDSVDFGMPAGQGISRIAAGRLSDGRIQLFATTAPRTFSRRGKRRLVQMPNGSHGRLSTLTPIMMRLPRPHYRTVDSSYGGSIETGQCGVAGKSRPTRMRRGLNGRFFLRQGDTRSRSLRPHH